MFKDFDAMLSVGRPDFTVGGQKFTARAKLPWKKFSNLILSMSGEDVTSADGISKTEEFFRLVLIPSDRQRFMDLMNNDGDEDDNDEHIVSPTQISDIIDWMLVFYTKKENDEEEVPETPPPSNGKVTTPISLNPLV